MDERPWLDWSGGQRCVAADELEAEHVPSGPLPPGTATPPVMVAAMVLTTTSSVDARAASRSTPAGLFTHRLSIARNKTFICRRSTGLPVTGDDGNAGRTTAFGTILEHHRRIGAAPASATTPKAQVNSRLFRASAVRPSCRIRRE
jgi:hypothetical protein